MFSITLAGDWWPIAVLPILFGPGGIMPWILGGAFNNRPWIVAIASVLVLQFIIISALGASIGHFAMYLTFGPHVPGLTDSTTGRAAEQLYVSSSPQTWIPGLITAGIALMLAVIMAAVTGASSARQNGTAMNRLRIIAYVLSCLGFVALLIAICIMPASLRNKQTNILLAVLAFLTLVVWIPGIKRRSGGFRMKDPTSSDQEKQPDYLPSSVSRRDASVCAASATGTATESELSRLRISIVPLFTVSRPATAISGTPISSASLNLTPGETFLRSS